MGLVRGVEGCEVVWVAGLWVGWSGGCVGCVWGEVEGVFDFCPKLNYGGTKSLLSLRGGVFCHYVILSAPLKTSHFRANEKHVKDSKGSPHLKMS